MTTTYTDHYLAKAEECEHHAETASTEALRQVFLDAARGWRRIAEIPGLKSTEVGAEKK